MKVLLESQTFLDGRAQLTVFGLSSSSILEIMMSGVGTPTRSPSAFERYAQGAQDDPILMAAAAGGTPWPGQPQQPPPGMPSSFERYNIAVGETPGAASNLGETATAQQDIQAQMASMLIAMKQMYDQLQQLAAKANQQQQPQQQQPQQQQPQQQQPQPQQPQLQQQQPQQQPEPQQHQQRVDPWQQSINSGSGGFPAGPGGGGSGGFPGGSGDN